VQKKLADGLPLRQDNFFQETANDRATADEVVEGIVLAAQREYEERKLQFYGNLIANIAFHSEVNRTQANLFIRQAERMSYRQLCLWSLFVCMDELKIIRTPRMYPEHPEFEEG
jgi:hypothetical protein